jgi:hypothetical protein
MKGLVTMPAYFLSHQGFTIDMYERNGFNYRVLNYGYFLSVFRLSPEPFRMLIQEVRSCDEQY